MKNKTKGAENVEPENVEETSETSEISENHKSKGLRRKELWLLMIMS